MVIPYLRVFCDSDGCIDRLYADRIFWLAEKARVQITNSTQCFLARNHFWLIDFELIGYLSWSEQLRVSLLVNMFRAEERV
jgi:hypothetical protein